MVDRIMFVLVRIKVRGHLVMSIIQFMNLISVHLWTYLRTGESPVIDRRKFLLHVYLWNRDVLFICINCTRGILGGQLTLTPKNRHHRFLSPGQTAHDSR